MVVDPGASCCRGSSTKKRGSVRGAYSGLACVHYAARWGSAAFLQHLVLRRGLPASQPWPTSTVGATPAHDAVTAGNLPALRWLLANTDSDVNSRDGGGATVVHLAARYGRLDALKAMVKTSTSGHCAQAVHARTNTGAIPLHFAVSTGRLDVVRFLVERGPSTSDSRMNSGATPCYLAAQQGHLEVLRFLIEHAGATARIYANDGMTCAHAAAQSGHLDTLKYLIVDLKTRVNECDSEGNTLLHYAARQGHVAVTDWLLRNGGLSLVDTFGSTPLHDAAQNGHLQCVRLLLRHKSSAIAVDADGCTAYELATICGHPACAAVIAISAKKNASPRNCVSADKRAIPWQSNNAHGTHKNGAVDATITTDSATRKQKGFASTRTVDVSRESSQSQCGREPTRMDEKPRAREVARRPTISDSLTRPLHATTARADRTASGRTGVTSSYVTSPRVTSSSDVVACGEASARERTTSGAPGFAPARDVAGQRHAAPALLTSSVLTSSVLTSPGVFGPVVAPLAAAEAYRPAAAPVLAFQPDACGTLPLPLAGGALTLPGPLLSLPRPPAPLAAAYAAPVLTPFTPARFVTQARPTVTQPPASLLLAPTDAPVLTHVGVAPAVVMSPAVATIARPSPVYRYATPFTGAGQVPNGAPFVGAGHVLNGALFIGAGHVVNGAPFTGGGQVVNATPFMGAGHVANGAPFMDLGHVVNAMPFMGAGHVVNSAPFTVASHVANATPFMGAGHVTNGAPFAAANATPFVANGALFARVDHMANATPFLGAGHVTNGAPFTVAGHVASGVPFTGVGHVPGYVAPQQSASFYHRTAQATAAAAVTDRNARTASHTASYNPGGYGTNEAHVISKKSLLHVPPPSQSNNPAPLTSHGLTSHAVSRRNSTSSAPLNVTLRRNNVGSASFSTRFASGRERALPAASHPTRPPFGVTKITKIRIELSGDYDPKQFVDRVPRVDTAGLEIPVWKRQLIARQLAEKAYRDNEDSKRRVAAATRVREMQGQFDAHPVSREPIVDSGGSGGGGGGGGGAAASDAFQQRALPSVPAGGDTTMDEDGLPLSPWQSQLRASATRVKGHPPTGGM